METSDLLKTVTKVIIEIFKEYGIEVIEDDNDDDK